MKAALGLLLALALAAPVEAQRAPLAWSSPTRDTRPWTRWWWLGSAVDSANLTASLKELAAAGFGGVEITAIYGVKGADSAYVPYLSERWVRLLAHTVSEARKLGMGVDMPPGSGWRTGGPFVSAVDANASMRISVDSTHRGGPLPSDYMTDLHVTGVAVSNAGNRVTLRELTPDSRQIQQMWLPTDSTRWTLYVARTGFSGDNVKRPAPGGEGKAIDVFSRSATDNFLRTYGERLGPLPRGAIRSYFHDSFEYTGNGSVALFDEFRRRRGYDLAIELPALAGRGDPDRVARVKSDYRQTLDEMLHDNFVARLNAWAHERGSLTRNQAHGSPGNLLDLYAAADIPETEIFGPLDGPDSDPLINKFASSAAHVAGRPLASAEAFTWLGEHFTATLGDVKRAADELFLGGINHLIYHGTAYSPKQAAWPGWLFYASAEFNPQNAFWRDLPAFNQYVTRVQSALQWGRPDEDVLLYWPVWDSWHDARGLRMDFRVHAPTWLHEKPVGEAARALWESRVGFDYVSDRLLAERVSAANGRLRARSGSEWTTLLVPRTTHMPAETLQRLVDLARAGATVAFVGALPPDVPGLARLEAHRASLAAAAQEVVLGPADAAGVRTARLGRGRVIVGNEVGALVHAARIRSEGLRDHPGVRFVRRRGEGGSESQYFAQHGGTTPIDGWVPLGASAAAVAIMDPMSGRTGLASMRAGADGRTEIRLQLDPGESVVLRTFVRPPASAARWPYRRIVGSPAPLTGQWSVRFLDGGPALPPSFTSDSLAPWTGHGDEEADRFAGTALYTLRFDAPGSAANYLLELGRVAESARVRLNGRDLGTLFAAPFRVETGPLRATGNVLEVEVTNLSANRIRDLDRRKVEWRIFRDINYVGIDYRPFDASGWPVRTSGLVGPVTLRALER